MEGLPRGDLTGPYTFPIFPFFFTGEELSGESRMYGWNVLRKYTLEGAC